MNEFDGDFVEDVFSEYLDETTARIKPPGTAAAMRAVRRRRRKRLSIMATVAVLMIAIPAAAYAIVSRQSSSSPAPAESSSPDAVPSTSPAVEKTPAVTTVKSDPLPAGGFTAAELQDATFILPSWEDTTYDASARCTSGRRTFKNRSSELGVLLSETLSYVDLDEDGKFETVVLLLCRRQGEVGPEQVVVLRRGSGSAIETVGQVINTSEGIAQIGELDGLTGGTVRVEVRDDGLCCDSLYTSSQHQWRYYRWNGQKFSQSAGSTAFHPASTQTDLVVITSEVVFGKAEAGTRKAVMRLTVKNAGSVNAEEVALRLRLHEMQIEDKGWESRPFYSYRKIGPLAAGATMTYDIALTTKAANANLAGLNVIGVVLNANDDMLQDPHPRNNESDSGTGVAVKFS